MHSVRHSSARYSVALAKIFMSKCTFHSQTAIFLRGKALLFFIKKYYPYKIYSSPLNMQRSFLRNVFVLSLVVWCSLPSIIQYVFQNIRFLHNMQCVIDIFYCCQKRCNDQCTLKTPWKKNRFIFLQIRSNSLAKKIYFVKTMQYIL